MRPRRRVRLTSLHALCIALAREPRLIAFARRLVAAASARDRLARLAVAFSFVRTLPSVVPTPGAHDAVAGILDLVGEDRGPAVLLTALLLALGERVQIECTREMAFVRAELAGEDLPRLPPHARLIQTRGRVFLPLDPRGGRSPFGFLRQPDRRVLTARRSSLRALA